MGVPARLVVDALEHHRAFEVVHPKVSATCEMKGVTMGQWVFHMRDVVEHRRPTAMFFRSSKARRPVPVAERLAQLVVVGW